MFKTIEFHRIGCLLLQLCLAVASPKEAHISPIANFENSWIASSAQSTLVSLPVQISDEEQGVIILLRSKNSEALESIAECNTVAQPEVVSSLRLTDSVLLDEQTARERSPWTILSPTTLCAMTGLASDAEFLVRALQQSVEHHRSIYDEAVASQSNFLSTFKLVQILCRLIQEPTAYQGARPYGVQALLIGSNPQSSSSLDIYTVDPSGSFHHWPRGTAIGRNALKVRNELADVLEEHKGDNAEKALELALLTCLGADGAASASNFAAVLVTRRRTGLSVAKVDPGQIKSLLDGIVDTSFPN